MFFIMICIFFINSTTFASDALLSSWLGEIADISDAEKFYHFSYKQDNTRYESYFMKILLPEQSTTYPRISYSYGSSGSINFIYEVKEGDVLKSYPVKFNLLVCESVDEQGNETYRNILKRQSANNFNAVDGANFGYLLEVAPNITSFEGKKIKFLASIDASNNSYSAEVELLSEGWTQATYFKKINQNDVEQNFFQKLWAWITNGLEEVKNLLEEIFTKLLLALGDGIYAAICTAVGEPITMDRIIFGKVGKLSINFWDGVSPTNANTNVSGINSVMSVMKDVVSDWYNIFFSIAVLVYLVALLFVGVKILLTSTGEGKAKYKEVFTSWVTGVMILMLFPYVMKYTVKLNNMLVEMINTDFIGQQTDETEPIASPEMNEGRLDAISGSFGEGNFVTSMGGAEFVAGDIPKRDMMLYIRNLAGNLGKLSLVFVYFILLGQLIVLIVVYYKRVFMMAFLITIFPIIAIMYIVEKLGSGNSSAFGTWFKEYAILIFTQSFHAAVYVIVVNAGVEAYIQSDNWLFMLMSFIFLFEGEKILRSIFGAKSSANVIKDLAEVGVASYGLVKSMPNLFKGAPKEDKDAKDLAEATKKAKPKPQIQNANASQQAENTEASATATGGGNQNSEADMQESTNNPMENFTTAQSAVIAEALRGRQKSKGNGAGNGVFGAVRKVGGTALKVAGGTLGGVIGAAAGLAQGDLSKTVTGAMAGKAIADGAMKIAKIPITGISNLYHGERLRRRIKSGKMDKQLKDAGFDIASLETETQKLIRNALANLGAGTTMLGKNSGEHTMLDTVRFENFKKRFTKKKK